MYWYPRDCSNCGEMIDYAAIHPDAKIGKKVHIGSGTIIGPNVVIHDNVWIGSNCVIGGPPEHRGYYSAINCGVVIGAHTRISHLVTIDEGTTRTTNVGAYNTILRGAHIGHDALTHWHVVVASNAIVGGHVTVCEGANLGLGVITHQFSVIGAYSMLGMGTIVTKKSRIKTGGLYVGNPAKFVRQNIVGLDRAKLSLSQLEYFVAEFESLINEVK